MTRHTKLSSRVSAYSEYADDESSDSSATGVGISEYRLVQGTFPSTDVIRIRWASPLYVQDFPDQGDGLRRVGVDSVQGHLTCTVLEARNDGSVKMRLDYQGTLTGLWFPGVATKLGLDIGLDGQGNRVTWPDEMGSAAQWTVDGDAALTGFSIGVPKKPSLSGPSSAGLDNTLLEATPPPPSPSTQTQLQSPDQPSEPENRDTSGLLNEAPPFSGSSTASSNTGVGVGVGGGPSLLRVPLPHNRQVSAEYSFEDSATGSNLPSSILHSSGTGTDMANMVDMASRPPPITPITLHVNLNELSGGPPPRNKLTVNISGTVVVTPTVVQGRVLNGAGTSDTDSEDEDEDDADEELGSLKIPEFHVFSANLPLTENVTTIVRNQCEGASVELLNSQTAIDNGTNIGIGDNANNKNSTINDISSSNNGFGKSSLYSTGTGYGKSTTMATTMVTKRTIVPIGSQVRCNTNNGINSSGSLEKSEILVRPMTGLAKTPLRGAMMKSGVGAAAMAGGGGSGSPGTPTPGAVMHSRYGHDGSSRKSKRGRGRGSSSRRYSRQTTPDYGEEDGEGEDDEDADGMGVGGSNRSSLAIRRGEEEEEEEEENPLAGGTLNRSLQKAFLTTLSGAGVGMMGMSSGVGMGMSTAVRDGAFVIPWVNAEVVPLAPIYHAYTRPVPTSTPSPAIVSRKRGTEVSAAGAKKKIEGDGGDGSGSGSGGWYQYQYGVTLSLPTPVDGPSEWLEFGLAPTPGRIEDMSSSGVLDLVLPKQLSRSTSLSSAFPSPYPSPQIFPSPVLGSEPWIGSRSRSGSGAEITDSRMGQPIVEVKGASVNGVPVRFECSNPSDSPLPGSDGKEEERKRETKEGGDVDGDVDEKERWVGAEGMGMTMVRVHIALAGALEVVYVVKGVLGPSTTEGTYDGNHQKGKDVDKRERGMEGMEGGVDVLLPVFSIPITRFEINLKRSAGMSSFFCSVSFYFILLNQPSFLTQDIVFDAGNDPRTSMSTEELVRVYKNISEGSHSYGFSNDYSNSNFDDDDQQLLLLLQQRLLQRQDTYRKASAIDVAAHIQAFNSVRLPKSLLLPKNRSSRSSSLLLDPVPSLSSSQSISWLSPILAFFFPLQTRTRAQRRMRTGTRTYEIQQQVRYGVYVFVKILPYLFVLFLFVRQTVIMNALWREQVRQQGIVEALPGRVLESMGVGMGGGEGRTVTVTRTVVATSEATKKKEGKGWFGETYTVTQVKPSSRPTSGSGSGSKTGSTESTQNSSSDEETTNEGEENEYGYESSEEGETENTSLSYPLSPGSVFFFPIRLSYENVKTSAAYGWGRILKVWEVILHWPLPVEDH